MDAQWVVDRRRLRTLRDMRPDWTLQDLADAIGRSRSWVKKWLKRLCQTAPDDEAVLVGHSSARHTPPPQLSQLVIDRILAIRDDPPHNLQRIPGPKAILYYIEQEATTTLQGERLPRSSRTIWRILRQHQRIVDKVRRAHHGVERPEPMQSWQIDFKDASTVPSDPDGKQQHVVEVLDAVDVGTSILIAAEARPDFTMTTAIETAAAIVTEQGLPDMVTLDRDPRFVGESHQRESPAPFLRFWLCLGVQVTICPPRRPDLNGFVERYHRTYEEECLQVYRPADLESVRTVTAAFQQHYNDERPHQGHSCGNQPPRVAFPVLPARPPVPLTVDPDRWISALHGKCYVRKVQQDTGVTVGTGRYYLTRALIGQTVTLQIDATDRTLVVAHNGQEVKRVAIAGSGRGRVPFAQFVELLCAEARTGRVPPQAMPRQLALPLEGLSSGHRVGTSEAAHAPPVGDVAEGGENA
jgi:transposase InsO family protein